MEDIRRAFRPHEARFSPRVHRFSNSDILAMLDAEHVPTFVRPDGRIFPVSGRAEDVVKALMRHASGTGVELRLQCRVSGIDVADGCVTGAPNGPKEHSLRPGRLLPRAACPIRAQARPETVFAGGSNSGMRWSHRPRHSHPSAWSRRCHPTGAVWRCAAASLAIYVRGTKLAEWNGDILFTHEGVSGPAALELSRHASEAGGAAELRFDFIPGTDVAALDDELVVVIRKNPGEDGCHTAREPGCPAGSFPLFLMSIGVGPDTRCAGSDPGGAAEYCGPPEVMAYRPGRPHLH